MSVSFDIPAHDEKLIRAIAKRAALIDRKYNGRRAMPVMHHAMNVTAAHANGNRLRLCDLLEADDFNFAHDVFGIDRHLNRSTGQLEKFFSPRFSFREAA